MATLKEIQSKLRPHGVVVKKTGYGNEHRVNYRGGREETAHYTDDPNDALGTGLEMAKPEHAMKEHEHPYWDKKK